VSFERDRALWRTLWTERNGVRAVDLGCGRGKLEGAVGRYDEASVGAMQLFQTGVDLGGFGAPPKGKRGARSCSVAGAVFTRGQVREVLARCEDVPGG
jgi:hypothetical protein